MRDVFCTQHCRCMGAKHIFKTCFLAPFFQSPKPRDVIICGVHTGLLQMFGFERGGDSVQHLPNVELRGGQRGRVVVLGAWVRGNAHYNRFLVQVPAVPGCAVRLVRVEWVR